MPEGLRPAEATELTSAVTERAGEGGQRHLRALSILEAGLLSIVTLALAWSGYAAAKWSTESSVTLARASTARIEASRADLQALELRNFDSSTFEAWFAAYAAGNQEAMALAESRFRPEFDVAFRAWLARSQGAVPGTLGGPTSQPEYEQPLLEDARARDQEAAGLLEAGADMGSTSDEYVRTTILLASVLFFVGISAHFPLHQVHYGLVGLGIVLLVVAGVQLVGLPQPEI
jgi:hypothetical protein